MATHILSRTGRRFTVGDVSSPITGTFFIPPTKGVNIIAINWASQVVTNGGSSPSNANITAAGTFWDSIQAAGLDSQMYSVNIVAPDNMTAALTPLFTGSNGGLSLWTATPNTSAFTLSSNGLSANVDGATSIYLTTGITQNNIWTSGNFGVSTYVYSFSTAFGSFHDVSSGNSASPRALTGAGNNDAFTHCFVTATDQTPAPNLGLFGFNRVSTTSCDIYQANSSQSFSSLIHNTATNSNSPGANAYYFYTYTPGNQYSYTGVLSFMAVHNGLNSTQAQNLYNAVQALRTSFGGGYR